MIADNSFGNYLSIKNVYDQVIKKTAEEYKGKESVIIEGLENCEVYLPFLVKSLYIKNLDGCHIYVGSVSGASFINNAKKCQIHLCSH